MGNTIDSALIPSVLSKAVIDIVGVRLAPLAAYSRNCGVNPLAPRQGVQVPLAKSGATGQQNATDFEDGNSELDNVAVTVNQETVSFHLSNAELNSGIRLAQIAKVNAAVLAAQISDRVTALRTTANFGAGTAIGSASSFDAAGLPDILTLAKDFPQKNLILDGGHLAYLLPTSRESFRLGEAGAFGFDLIAAQNRWTSAANNIAGFVCSQNAIAVASGLPAPLPSQEYLEIGNVPLDTGLVVQYAVWYARKSRSMWASYDVMFGAAVGDAAQGKLLVTV